MSREEAIKIIRKMLACTDLTVRANLNADMVSACNFAIKELEQEPILDKLKVEINKNIEQEDFARSVFLYEEKDLDRANKCVGILEAYKKVLDMIDHLLKENKDGNDDN